MVPITRVSGRYTHNLAFLSSVIKISLINLISFTGISLSTSAEGAIPKTKKADEAKKKKKDAKKEKKAAQEAKKKAAKKEIATEKAAKLAAKKAKKAAKNKAKAKASTPGKLRLELPCE